MIRFAAINQNLSFRRLLTGCLILLTQTVAAQKPDTAAIRAKFTNAPKDSILYMLRQLIADEGSKGVTQYFEDRKEQKREELFEDIKKILARSKAYLKNNVDTPGIRKELDYIRKVYSIAGDGIFNEKGNEQTFRNLITSNKIITELLTRAIARKVEVERYQRDLMNFRNNIDSLSIDSSLFQYPNDSANLKKALERLLWAAREIAPSDSILKAGINLAQQLNTQVDQTVITLDSSIEVLNNYEAGLSARSFQREFANLWEDAGNARPFSEILHFSSEKAKLSFYYYARNHMGAIVLIILLIACCQYFLSSLKGKLKAQNKIRDDYAGQMVIRYPLLSSIVIILSVFQFIFPPPPFLFNGLFWVISAVCLTFIIRNILTHYWMDVWLILLVFFLLACTDTLTLQASRVERWGMLVLALIGTAFGVAALLGNRKKELQEKSLIYFIGFITFLEGTSAVANLFGRYNLAKTLMTSGFFNMFIAIVFIWTIRLINNGLQLASHVYEKPEGNSFYINFKRVGEKAPSIFYLFLVIGWFILFGRNFYIFRLITEPVEFFLFRERTIGTFSFTIISLLAFVFILALAAIISRIVSFFTAEKDSIHEARDGNKTQIGSWLLLIRIGIICLGLFFACAAAGVSLDKITIIMGALGVGIGLGLQSLVNNLVSGIVIAFEKPVNVGDVIEITGQTGTVRVIGFRSSTIYTTDGANLVIPNGVLLNQNLINWSKENNSRRGEIQLSIAYNADLGMATDLLKQLLHESPNVLHYPEPLVLNRHFGEGTIQLSILFWSLHARNAATVKSELITAIQNAFKEHQIDIPIPAQELHILSMKERDPKTE